jgi:hypothetical protein
LKEKIGNVFEVKPYKTPQQLVSMMVDDLMEVIDKDFPDQEVCFQRFYFSIINIKII